MSAGHVDTVGAALALARSLGVDRLDAQLLLARALKQPRTWVLAHDDARLPQATEAVFMAQCQRRAAGEPLAYLLGEREFHGLMLQVTSAVLVPRPETETLVDWALELLAGGLRDRPVPRLADLGTGSGAIALALKHDRPDIEVCAVDLSAEALAVARANAAYHGLAVEFLAGDWWQPLQGRRFDLVVSNPPYVAADDPHLEALRHEPVQALRASGNGLAAFEAILRHAAQHLAPGGWLLLEHGHEQAEAVQRLLAQAGLSELHTRPDLAGKPRCSGGQRMGG